MSKQTVIEITVVIFEICKKLLGVEGEQSGGWVCLVSCIIIQRDGKIYIKLCAVRTNRVWSLREGLSGDQQQRQEGVRHKGDPHKQIQRKQEALGMHSQRDKYPNEHRGPPQHHQVLRYAKDIKQLLFHLRVLQRRHPRGSPLQAGETYRAEGLAHIQTALGSLPGSQQVQHHASRHETRQYLL